MSNEPVAHRWKMDGDRVWQYSAGPPSCDLGDEIIIERLYTAPSDDSARIRREAFEEAAKWHEGQANIVMNSLHCGDGSGEIWRARRKADWHSESAAAIRALADTDAAPPQIVDAMVDASYATVLDFNEPVTVAPIVIDNYEALNAAFALAAAALSPQTEGSK